MPLNDQESIRCPQCGAEVSPSDLEGVCPRCLTQLAFGENEAGDRSGETVALG